MIFNIFKMYFFSSQNLFFDVYVLLSGSKHLGTLGNMLRIIIIISQRIFCNCDYLPDCLFPWFYHTVKYVAIVYVVTFLALIIRVNGFAKFWWTPRVIAIIQITISRTCTTLGNLQTSLVYKILMYFLNYEKRNSTIYKSYNAIIQLITVTTNKLAIKRYNLNNL